MDDHKVWDGFDTWQDVMNAYDMKEPEPDKIYLANYTCGSYDGDSVVLYRRGTKYYENTGSHCSCKGLEDCWGPVEYDSKEQFLGVLKMRKAGYTLSEEDLLSVITMVELEKI